MTRNDARKLIEELLALYASRNFTTVTELMIYQRGYLTGILADIIRDDFYAEQKIRKKIAGKKS